MRKIFSIIRKMAASLMMLLIVYVLINSALDIYNNFAYDKAIVRESPYGFIPMLASPLNYRVTSDEIKSGDFVYVEDWVSSGNERITFAKVKSKLHEGYINRDLLTQTNINVKPIISVLFLTLILMYYTRKIYKKIRLRNDRLLGKFDKFNVDYSKFQIH